MVPATCSVGPIALGIACRHSSRLSGTPDSLAQVMCSLPSSSRSTVLTDSVR